MSLRLSKKGVIPYLPSEAAAQAGLIRDLLSYIKAGDTGSGSGMTVPVMNRLVERPFVGSLTCWLPNTMILYRTQVKYQLNNHEDIAVISLSRLKMCAVQAAHVLNALAKSPCYIMVWRCPLPLRHIEFKFLIINRTGVCSNSINLKV